MEKSIAREIKNLDISIGKIVIDGDKAKETLNRTQFQILTYLIKNKNKNVCQKDLEIETHLKKASITGTLDSLEDKGIIYRKQDTEDKRKNCIYLSKKALVAKDKLEEKFKEVELLARKNISEQELNNFFNVIEKIQNNLNERII